MSEKQRGLLTWLALVGLFLSGLGSASAGSGDGWQPAQNLSANQGSSLAVSMDQNPVTGRLHAVWVDNATGNNEILASSQNPITRAWTPPRNLSTFAWNDGGAALLFDREGRGHLLWTRRYARALGAPDEGSDVVYRQWLDGVWQPEQVLYHSSSYTPGVYGLILVEKSDRVVLFLTWNTGYRSAEFRDGAWSALTPWDYSLGVILAGARADDQDRLHFAALGLNSSQAGYDVYFVDAYYLRRDGAGWTQPLNISSTVGVAADIDLAFDATGRLHLLWSDQNSNYSSESLISAVWENVWDGASWSGNRIVTATGPDRTILDMDLETGQANSLHLAWSEGPIVNGMATGADIYAATGDGTTWALAQEVYTSTLLSTGPDLVVDDADPGSMAVAWQEGEVDRWDILATDRTPAGAFYRHYLLPIGKGAR